MTNSGEVAQSVKFFTALSLFLCFDFLQSCPPVSPRNAEHGNPCSDRQSTVPFCTI